MRIIIECKQRLVVVVVVIAEECDNGGLETHIWHRLVGWMAVSLTDGGCE